MRTPRGGTGDWVGGFRGCLDGFFEWARATDGMAAKRATLPTAHGVTSVVL